MSTRWRNTDAWVWWSTYLKFAVPAWCAITFTAWVLFKVGP